MLHLVVGIQGQLADLNARPVVAPSTQKNVYDLKVNRGRAVIKACVLMILLAGVDNVRSTSESSYDECEEELEVICHSDVEFNDVLSDKENINEELRDDINKRDTNMDNELLQLHNTCDMELWGNEEGEDTLVDDELEVTVDRDVSEGSIEYQLECTEIEIGELQLQVA